MATKITQRAVITQDVPSMLLTLKLPVGFTLDKWVKLETERLKAAYPVIKEPSIELGREYREAVQVAKHNAQYWTEKYELMKLAGRGDMRFAKKATADGIPFLDRRIFPVKGYEVDPFTQDAIFPV